jgi:hypothetical protein
MGRLSDLKKRGYDLKHLLNAALKASGKVRVGRGVCALAETKGAI